MDIELLNKSLMQAINGIGRLNVSKDNNIINTYDIIGKVYYSLYNNLITNNLISFDHLTKEMIDTYNFLPYLKYDIVNNIKNISAKSDIEYKINKLSYIEDAIYLIPLFLVPIIPKGIKLINILGDEIIYNGSNISLDTNNGCIAYGIPMYKGGM